MEENKEILNTLSDPREIAEYAVTVLDSKKAHDIKLLHVEKQTVIADYVVICSGTSRTQIRSLADEVEFKLGERGVSLLRTEGMDTGLWVLKDFGAVIVHIFNADTRDFYKLEKLYDGTSAVDVSGLISE